MDACHKPNSQEDSRVWKKKITGLIEGTHFAAFSPQLLSQADKTFKKGFLQKQTRK